MTIVENRKRESNMEQPPKNSNVYLVVTNEVKVFIMAKSEAMARLEFSNEANIISVTLLVENCYFRDENTWWCRILPY